MAATVLTIKRLRFSNVGTFGRASLDDGGKVYDSIEPPKRGPDRGLSCVPAGVYRAYTHDSRRLGVNLYELQVPGRSGVEINGGAWAGDVGLGFYFDLLGMISLGFDFETQQPPDRTHRPQIALMHSREGMLDFMGRTMGYGITVEIIDPP